MKSLCSVYLIMVVWSCNSPADTVILTHDSVMIIEPVAHDSVVTPDTTIAATASEGFIDTKNVHPEDVISFAKQWQHVPYVYASSDPNLGFDCSGFISFVFNHFHIDVPRSSVDFTHRGRQVSLSEARKADLILFTGTDSTIRVVGHMGIVIDNTDSLRFIHSTSGKANGVTITALNSYYNGRFISIRRIFPE